MLVVECLADSFSKVCHVMFKLLLLIINVTELLWQRCFVLFDGLNMIDLFLHFFHLSVRLLYLNFHFTRVLPVVLHRFEGNIY